jgi:energy-converting hydrogenase B subunit D
VSVLQAVCLVVVAAAGTATVLVHDPLRQALVSGMLGLSLAVLFLAFGAPDVALSQIVVAGVAVPVMVLLTLAKIRFDEREREEEEADAR